MSSMTTTTTTTTPKRVAIAGGGSLAKYFAEELPKTGLEVVILTHSPKPFFNGKPGVVAQRITDYSSVDQLTPLLADCDALLSTIMDFSPDFITMHLNLIAACKQSPKCKRFIPAEYGGDTDKYPDQPLFYESLQGVVRKALQHDASDDKLESTVVCIGAFIDMYLPKTHHYFNYITDMYSRETNTIEMIGTGDEQITVTTARDTARAIARLLLAPQGSWRPLTYIQGQKVVQKHMLELLQKFAGNSDTQFHKRSLTQLIQTVVANESIEASIWAQIDISLLSGAVTLDDAKVARDRAEFFPDLVFETVDDVFARLAIDPQAQM